MSELNSLLFLQRFGGFGGFVVVLFYFFVFVVVAFLSFCLLVVWLFLCCFCFSFVFVCLESLTEELEKSTLL